MRKALAPAFVFCAVTCLAGTIENNFTSYSDFWHPLGNPNTATYGETFSAPTNGDADLTKFGFYMGNPFVAGDIKLSGYIATWTGTQAGTILYTSPMVDYANTGDFFLSFNTGGLNLTAGAEYVAFLSVSQYYGQSSGETYVSQGGATIPGGNFVYYNNSGNFAALTSSSWDVTGTKPDWAVDLEFATGGIPDLGVPEPSSVVLLGAGLVGLASMRRKLHSLFRAS